MGVNNIAPNLICTVLCRVSQNERLPFSFVYSLVAEIQIRFLRRLAKEVRRRNRANEMESSNVPVSLQGWESVPYQTRSLVLKEIQNLPPPLKKKTKISVKIIN